MGDGVGEQADARFVADAGAHDGRNLGRVDGGQGVVRQLDNVDARRGRKAEGVGEEVVFAGGGLRELVGRGLVGDGDVNLDVAGANRDGGEITAGNDGSGESGLGPVEVVLVAGLAIGERDRILGRPWNRWQRRAFPGARGCAVRR